jgi:hypothetical protein
MMRTVADATQETVLVGHDGRALGVLADHEATP